MEIEDVIDLIVWLLPFVMVGGAWLIHHNVETSRHRYLDEQEAHFRGRIRLTNLKRFPAGCCESPVLVTGSAVIANNYFVSFVSRFKHVFGGEMSGYTQLCTDARRLALVRLLQEAESMGANVVYNVRFETASILSATNGKQMGGGVELIAYGTAVRETVPLAILTE